VQPRCCSRWPQLAGETLALLLHWTRREKGVAVVMAMVMAAVNRHRPPPCAASSSFGGLYQHVWRRVDAVLVAVAAALVARCGLLMCSMTIARTSQHGSSSSRNIAPILRPRAITT